METQKTIIPITVTAKEALLTPSPCKQLEGNDVQIDQELQKQVDDDRMLKRFLKNDKNKEYREPFREILNLASKPKADVHKVKAGLVRIVNIVSSKNLCSKCGHQYNEKKRSKKGNKKKPAALYDEDEIRAEDTPVLEVIGNCHVDDDSKQRIIPSELENEAWKFLKREEDQIPFKEEDYEKFFTCVSKGGKCPKCDQEFDTKSTLLFHKPCRYKKLYSNPTCPICHEKWPPKQIKTCFSHMESKHFHSKKFKCLICPQEKEATTIKKDSMVRHCLRIHIRSKSFSCLWPDCGKGFRYHCSGLKHIMADHLKKMPFKCDICDKGFLSKPTAEYHSLIHKTSLFERITYFSKRLFYQCPLEGCPNKNIHQLEDLRSHLNFRHPNGDYDVEEMIRKAQAIYEAKRLKRKKQNGPDFKVDMDQDGQPKIIVEHPEIPDNQVPNKLPKLTYYSIQNLEKKAMEYIQHDPRSLKDTYHDLFKFTPIQEPCRYKTCDEIFDQKSKAISHRLCRLQIPKDPISGHFMCEICQQSYVNRHTLQTHLDFHFAKQLTCLVCSKDFYDIPSVKVHISKVHHSVKSFTCKMLNCGMKLSDSRRALNHIIGYHFRIFPYKCDLCPAEESSKQRLTTHMNKFHPRPEDMIFPCFVEGCPEKFSWATNRNQHIKLNHKDFVWTEDHKKQNKLDRKNIKGTGELINGQLIVTDSAGVRESHVNLRNDIRVNGLKRTVPRST